MNDTFRKLRADAQDAERAAKSAKASLDTALRLCRHNYSEPQYDPIIIPGGHSEGDPVGTMGIDWRGPYSWPEERKPRWSRTCLTCGHVDYTTRTSEEPSTKKPLF